MQYLIADHFDSSFERIEIAQMDAAFCRYTAITQTRWLASRTWLLLKFSISFAEISVQKAQEAPIEAGYAFLQSSKSHL